MSPLSTLRFIASHPLSSSRPLRAFWRYGKWQIGSRLRRETEFAWIEGAKLIVRSGMTGATGNIYCGLHEFVDMGFALHLLRSGDLFVDVGANVGCYTVLASAVVGARSIAVEPDPGATQALRRNIAVNGLAERVTLRETALGSAPGRVRFTVGLGTMNRVATTADRQTREVQVATLDDILAEEHPIFIKVDVEGYESEVIAGSARTLQDPGLLAVLTETADAPVQSALKGAGFETAHYDPFERRLSTVAQVGKSTSNNTLFVRDWDACQERLSAAPVRHVFGQPV